MPRIHKSAGLDQLGPVRYCRPAIFKDKWWKSSGGAKSVKARASISTKNRKVKVTLADHA